jgi:hypothetical protein
MTNDSMASRTTTPMRGRLGTPWRGRPLPVHPLLLAAYPVLFLYGQNLGELDPSDLVVPLAAIVLSALVALIIGAYLVRDGRRAALVVSALAATLLLYGHVAGLLGPLGVRAAVLQVGWIVLVGLTVAFAIKAGSDRLAMVTRGMNFVTALLVIVTLVSIVPAELGRTNRNTTPVATIGGAAGAGRDIWYLVFDRYGSARSLDLLYEIDDRPFLGRLRDRGFEIATDSHANYVKTALSLAATLNLDYLDDLAAAQDPGSEDHEPIYQRLSDHAVGHFLHDRGYRYVHLGTTYDPTETSVLADLNPRIGGPSDFVDALFDTSALPAVARRLHIRTMAPARERHYQFSSFQLDTLDDLVGEPGPKFVLAHVLLPHPPYTFASDGRFLTDDEDEGLTNREGYAQQLIYLQARIEALVDRLLALPEAERPIIILQADEGPYPLDYAKDTIGYDWATATTEDLEIKFGIFNAMYLPGSEAPELPATLSSVNTFRLIFDAYFGADLPLLPDRSFTSAGKYRPYDLTDITDRLPQAEP